MSNVLSQDLELEIEPTLIRLLQDMLQCLVSLPSVK